MTRFMFENHYSKANKKVVYISPNTITVLVGKNGYGKSSFIHGLMHYAKIHNHTVLSWSDNEHGRNNGMQALLFNDNMQGLAAMAFHSEGEAMHASFGLMFAQKLGAMIRKLKVDRPKSNKVFLLIDQIDSGLDVHLIDDVKDFLRNVVIPDINKAGFDAFIVLSANSYELVNGEDCIDPVTRSHVAFASYDEFTDYINSQYKGVTNEGN